MTPRYSGCITFWSTADGFAEITTPGHGPLVAYADELRSGGVVPKIGARVDFEIGATARGNTGAINITPVPAIVLQPAPVAAGAQSAPAAAAPTSSQS